MAEPLYLVIHGRFVVEGKEPDGDSLRFIADDVQHYRSLRRAGLIAPARHDGSVQLRLDCVDAPELHYSGATQPLGREARDRLLVLMGFGSIQYDPQHQNLVKSSDPQSLQGSILSRGAEENGRPISYLFLERDGEGLAESDWIRVTDALLEKTVNCRLLAEGLAYYTAYTSTPSEHRDCLRAVAASARSDRLGVWGRDVTGEFVLAAQGSIGPDGQLILPKLFRRCTDYLRDVARGFQGSLVGWLVATSAWPRSEDDAVLLGDGRERHLSDLLRQDGERIVFGADPLELTFVDR